MTRQISEKIRVLGLFMTCAVVFYHCPSVGGDWVRGSVDAAANRFTDFVYGQMGTLAMSHFFAVTGYLLFQNYTLQSYPAKLRRRVSTLLVPYLVWQVLTVLLKLVVNRETVGLWEFVSKTFFFLRYPFNGALWYVYGVFFLAALSPVLLPLLKDRKNGLIGVLALSFLAEIKNYYTIPVVSEWLVYTYIDNILTYVPSFLVGCYCGRFCRDGDFAAGGKLILSICFAAILLDGTMPGVLAAITVKIMPMAILYLLPALPKMAGWKVHSLTFMVYAMHQPLIGVMWAILSRVYAVVPLPASVCNLTTRLAVLGVAMTAAAVIHGVLSRICPRALACLTGGRG